MGVEFDPCKDSLNEARNGVSLQKALKHEVRDHDQQKVASWF